MVHLHPRSLARCSCRLDLSLGIKSDWHHQQRGVLKDLVTREWENLSLGLTKIGLLMKELKRIVHSAGSSGGKPNGLPF